MGPQPEAEPGRRQRVAIEETKTYRIQHNLGNLPAPFETSRPHPCGKRSHRGRQIYPTLRKQEEADDKARVHSRDRGMRHSPAALLPQAGWSLVFLLQDHKTVVVPPRFHAPAEKDYSPRAAAATATKRT